MKFLTFKKGIADFPIFSTSHLNSLVRDGRVLRNQLTKWQNRGLVVKLRRGLYVLGASERRIQPSRFFLANQLHQPSYVSTEYAMAFYDLIPERVTDVTSVSSKKTATFKNEFGQFIYQHIKADCFTGYEIMADENGFDYFIAEPEKALIDFIYLNSSLFDMAPMEIFESLRLQNLGSLSMQKIKKYARLCNRQRILTITNALLDFLKKVPS